MPVRRALAGPRIDQIEVHPRECLLRDIERGQSFGGILAFEALTSASGLPLPRSLTLSNVPSSVPLLLEDVEALLAEHGGDGARFDATHVCRASPRPSALRPMARWG